MPTIPNVVINAHLNVPDSFTLVYNGVAFDPANPVAIDLGGFNEGEAKVIPFILTQTEGAPVAVVVTSSLSDPNWKDAIDPANPSVLPVGTAIMGSHTLTAPVTGHQGDSLTINFVVTFA